MLVLTRRIGERFVIYLGEPMGSLTLAGRRPGARTSAALWFLVALQGQCAAPWDLQQSGTKARLRGIGVVGGKVAWATGAAGTVLRTMDGGTHWTASVIPGGEMLD